MAPLEALMRDAAKLQAASDMALGNMLDDASYARCSQRGMLFD